MQESPKSIEAEWDKICELNGASKNFLGSLHTADY